MLIYSLILNVLLVISVIGLYVYFRRTKKRLEVVFLRAWGLEVRLMKIYSQIHDKAVREEIESILDNITPLE